MFFGPGKVIAGAAITAVLLASSTNSAQGAPYRPANNAIVLERLPDREAADDRDLAQRRSELRENPENLELALEIAKTYAELGRRKGDLRYEGYARAALSPWWNLANPPLQVRLLRAHLRQRQHDFEGALIDINAALLEQPDHPQAWLSKAMIHAVLGEPETTLQACNQLSDQTSSLFVAGCKAHAGRLIGEAEPSYRELENALRENADASPVHKVWLLTIMAEIAQQRDALETAERHFEEALSLDDQDPYLLGAYADLLLDLGRDDDVIHLLHDHVRIDALLLRSAIAAKRAGHPDATPHEEHLRIRFDAAARRADGVHIREQCRFALDVLETPDEALELAKRNWSGQRERADARLLLEAAIVSGRPDEAKPVLSWMRTTGIEDALLDALAADLERMT
jgi:tetratricopeptide (TPR) repeat protein